MPSRISGAPLLSSTTGSSASTGTAAPDQFFALFQSCGPVAAVAVAVVSEPALAELVCVNGVPSSGPVSSRYVVLSTAVNSWNSPSVEAAKAACNPAVISGTVAEASDV
jgi:hypothetical protein